MPGNLIEWAGPVLMVAALAALLARGRSVGIRIACAAGGAILALIPFGTQSFATFMLGLLGPVSVASLVLLATSIAASLSGTRDRTSIAMLVCLIAIGAVFYPLTLGLAAFDPYEFGYRGLWLPALMFLLVAIGWWWKALDMLAWLALAALLYVIGAYDSRNLWDYLIFPLDSVIAAGALGVAVCSRIRPHAMH